MDTYVLFTGTIYDCRRFCQQLGSYSMDAVQYPIADTDRFKVVLEVITPIGEDTSYPELRILPVQQ